MFMILEYKACILNDIVHEVVFIHWRCEIINDDIKSQLLPYTCQSLIGDTSFVIQIFYSFVSRLTLKLNFATYIFIFLWFYFSMIDF